MSASGAYLEGGETEVSGEAFMSTSNVVKPLGGPGSAPDPAGGGLRLAAPSPPAKVCGERCQLPQRGPERSQAVLPYLKYLDASPDVIHALWVGLCLLSLAGGGGRAPVSPPP